MIFQSHFHGMLDCFSVKFLEKFSFSIIKCSCICLTGLLLVFTSPKFFTFLLIIYFPGNRLLCKNRVRLRTIHQMVGPLPGPRVCGSFSAPGCPFLLIIYFVIVFASFKSVDAAFSLSFKSIVIATCVLWGTQVPH